MKSKVFFSKSGSGSISARVTIPKPYLEVLEITDEERDIEIKLDGKKLIITKAENNSK